MAPVAEILYPISIRKQKRKKAEMPTLFENLIKVATNGDEWVCEDFRSASGQKLSSNSLQLDRVSSDKLRLKQSESGTKFSVRENYLKVRRN